MKLVLMARNHKKNDWDKNKKIPGLVGPEGPQGASGGTGATGPQGPKGDKGDTGATGATGPAGANGADGQGVPTGGSSGQLLIKQSSTDFDTSWKTMSGDVVIDNLGAATIGSVGTWTPVDASGASLTLSNAEGWYQKIGQIAFIFFRCDYPTTSDTSPAKIGGLPFTPSNTTYTRQGSVNLLGYTGGKILCVLPNPFGSYMDILKASDGGPILNSELNGALIFGSIPMPIP